MSANNAKTKVKQSQQNPSIWLGKRTTRTRL